MPPRKTSETTTATQTPPPTVSKSKSNATKSLTATTTSIARTVGPAVPLAIALLHSAVLPGGTTGPAANLNAFNPSASVKCEAEIADFRDCHENYPTGCTKNGSTYDPFLNEMKNQISFGSMAPSQLVPKQTITSIDQLNQLEAKLKGIGLNQKNHASLSDQLAGFDEGSLYSVVGYLYAVEPEGAESSNCQLAKDPPDFQDVDYHIFVGFDPDVAANLRKGHAITAAQKHQSMVVEMTPHYREAFHPEWTVGAVKAVIGQQVKVLGQLMVDNEHFVAGQDCGIDPSNVRCWRASVWELHPVIDFQSCSTAQCSATSSAGWAAIGENIKNASASEQGAGKDGVHGNTQ